MGFAHPNVFAAEAVSLILMYLCIVRKQIKKVHIFVSMFFCGLIYILSQGRIAFFVGIIVIVLIALRKKKSIESIIYNFLPLSYIMVIILVIFFMAVYALLGENNLIVKILNDGFYNGRIGLAYRSLLAYPITLFGKAIDTSIWNQWQYYSLDNGQVMVLLEYGVAGFLTYYWLYKKTLIHIKQEKDIVFAIVIMGFILMSTYEGTMYFLGKNFTFLFLGTVNIESNQLFRKGDVHDT